MILKLLELFGKKRIVLDRGPSHPRYDLAKPWMNRYYVLFRNRPRWFPSLSLATPPNPNFCKVS